MTVTTTIILADCGVGNVSVDVESTAGHSAHIHSACNSHSGRCLGGGGRKV